MAIQNKTPRIYLPLTSAGVLIIIALVIVLKVPIWHMIIGGMIGAACLVGAFILLAVASDKLRLATKNEKKSGGFMKRKFAWLIILVLPLSLLTSCAGLGGSTDFGVVKIPTILVYIIVFGGLGWYMFRKH